MFLRLEINKFFLFPFDSDSQTLDSIHPNFNFSYDSFRYILVTASIHYVVLLIQ